MDKYHAFELGLAFGRGLMINKQAVSESMATDELQWITLKPKGQESEGYKHVQIDTETKTIVKGFGSGKTLTEAFKPKSEKIKEKLKAVFPYGLFIFLLENYTKSFKKFLKTTEKVLLFLNVKAITMLRRK